MASSPITPVRRALISVSDKTGIVEFAKSLEAKGHKFKNVNRTYGNMHAILLNRETNGVSAASDPRGVGEAQVQNP